MGMKLVMLVLVALFWISESVKAQVEQVSFCEELIDVHSSCTAETIHQLECGGNSMQWLYMTEDMMFPPEGSGIPGIPLQMLRQMSEKLEDFEQSEFTCEVGGEEFKANLIKHKKEGALRYRILSYGLLCDQGVIINIGLAPDWKPEDGLPLEWAPIIKWNN